MGNVVDLLRRRLNAKHRGFDGHHLALVIEGGGMRGVVAGGMVTALEQLGARDCFDTIHGSSAGACAGAYFVAGQAGLGTRIFYEDINNRHFISLLRPLAGRAIMQTSYLVDYIMRQIKPLDTPQLIKRPGFLSIVATNIRTCQPTAFSKFEREEDVFAALRATITMPLIAGHSVRIGSDRFFDGGMTQQIAIESAVQAGASHILVLLTRRQGELERGRKAKTRFSPDIVGLAALYDSAVATLYSTRNERINSELAIIARGRARNGAEIEAITRAATSTPVERLTMNQEVLERAAEEARKTVLATIETGYSR